MARGASNVMSWSAGIAVLLLASSALADPCDGTGYGGGSGGNGGNGGNGVTPKVYKNCAVFNNETYGAPVCGGDRRTYPNKPFLDCVNENRGTNVTVVFNGSCEDPCWVSTNEFSPCLPVCGSDGRTYQSRAALECYSNHLRFKLGITIGTAIRMAYVGKCCDPLAQNVTHQEIANITPENLVCGNDGKNYFNNWRLYADAVNVLGLTLLHPGPCRITCPYAPLYQPYCGSDKKTYGNLQALACHRQLFPYLDVKPQYIGECCPDPDNAPNPCTFPAHGVKANYVCASNGISYPSAQQVSCLRYNGANIRILHHGGCTVSEVKKSYTKKCGACDIAHNYPEWNPVCGINNITYSSPSALLCTNPKLTILYEGICGKPTYACCYSAVTKPANEVCGNDGRTYRNEDALLCATKDDPYLKLHSYGHCGVQDDPCLHRGDPYIDDAGTPVCATDGLTYITPQALWCARKTCPDLKYVHDGLCLTEKVTKSPVPNACSN